MMHETINHFTELAKGFIGELRNAVKSAEFKKVLNAPHETISVHKTKNCSAKTYGTFKFP
jgi:hypothetical protein